MIARSPQWRNQVANGHSTDLQEACFRTELWNRIEWVVVNPNKRAVATFNSSLTEDLPPQHPSDLTLPKTITLVTQEHADHRPAH